MHPRGPALQPPTDHGARDSLRASRSYRRPTGASVLDQAVAGLWQSTTLVPLPRPEVRVVTARAGAPVDVQLAVTVADGGRRRRGLGRSRPAAPRADPGGVRAALRHAERDRDLEPHLRRAQHQPGHAPGHRSRRPHGPERRPRRSAPADRRRARSAAITRCAAGERTRSGSSGTAAASAVRRRSRSARPATGKRSTPVARPRVVCGPITPCGAGAWTTSASSASSSGPPQKRPVQVGTASDWASVSTSWFHTCATRLTGTLWCWGLNDRGQLGDGTVRLRGRPVRVGQRPRLGLRHDRWLAHLRHQGRTAPPGAGVRTSSVSSATPTPTIATVPGQVGLDQAWLQLTAGWAPHLRRDLGGRGQLLGVQRPRSARRRLSPAAQKSGTGER